MNQVTTSSTKLIQGNQSPTGQLKSAPKSSSLGFLTSCFNFLLGFDSSHSQQPKKLDNNSAKLVLPTQNPTVENKTQTVMDRTIIFELKNGDFYANEILREQIEQDFIGKKIDKDGNQASFDFSKINYLNDTDYEQYLKAAKGKETLNETLITKIQQKREPIPTVEPEMIEPKIEVKKSHLDYDIIIDGPDLAKGLGDVVTAEDIKSLLQPFLKSNVFLKGWVNYEPSEITVLHDIMIENKKKEKNFMIEVSSSDLKLLNDSFLNDFYTFKFAETQKCYVNGQIESFFACIIEPLTLNESKLQQMLIQQL